MNPFLSLIGALRRPPVWLACALALGLAKAGEPAREPYRPRPVPPPARDASYLLPDGSIHVAGNDLVELYFLRLNEIFTRTHPGFKFKMDMQDSNLAIAGITSGKSAFGPIGRDAVDQELDGFAALHGYPPADVLLGYDQSPNTDIFPPGKTPPAVWINAQNPLPWLSVEQVARIFQAGAHGGDLTTWGQLGLAGEWGRRAIHVYLPGNRDAAFLFYTGYKLGRLPYTRRAELLPGPRDVMSAVAQDPFGIGLIGYWPPDTGWDRQAELGARLKIVPLSAHGEEQVSRAAPGDRFPFTPGIHVYFNRPPGHPVEPWLKEYLRLALSPEGQELLGAMAKEDANGFIPLEAKDAAAELAKIQ